MMRLLLPRKVVPSVELINLHRTATEYVLTPSAQRLWQFELHVDEIPGTVHAESI